MAFQNREVNNSEFDVSLSAPSTPTRQVTREVLGETPEKLVLHSRGVTSTARLSFDLTNDCTDDSITVEKQGDIEAAEALLTFTKKEIETEKDYGTDKNICFQDWAKWYLKHEPIYKMHKDDKALLELYESKKKSGTLMKCGAKIFVQAFDEEAREWVKIDLVQAKSYEVRSGIVKTVFHFNEMEYFMNGKKLSHSLKQRLLNEGSFTVSFGSSNYVFESMTDSIVCSSFSNGVLQEKIMVEARINRFDVYDANLVCGKIQDKRLCSACHKNTGKRCEDLKKKWFKKNFA